MVSTSCQMVVKAKLEKLGLEYFYVTLGEANIKEDLTLEQQEQLETELKEVGFVVIDNKKSIIVEKIKNIIIKLVHYNDDDIKVNLSDYLSEKLNYNYTYLANLFSKETGITIERFYLTHKIERVKELIIYDELNISEIAWKLQYSSVAHLSNQFKKHTGLTPTQFRRLKNRRRNALEDV